MGWDSGTTLGRTARLASVLAVMLAGACTQPAQDRVLRFDLPPPGGLEEGRAEYLAACASCHGVDARGGGPVGPALRTPPPDLTLLAWRRGGTFPRDEVIAVLAGERSFAAHGNREMPVWSQRYGVPGTDGATAIASIYARRRLELLASYLESVQR